MRNPGKHNRWRKGSGLLILVVFLTGISVTSLVSSQLLSQNALTRLQSSQRNQITARSLISQAVTIVRADIQSRLDTFQTVNGTYNLSGTFTGNTGTLGTYMANMVRTGGNRFLVNVSVTSNGATFSHQELIQAQSQTRPGTKRFIGAAGAYLTENNSAQNLGDINGDGYQDFSIGSPGASSGRGCLYIIFGRSVAAWKNLTASNGEFTLTNASQINRILCFTGRNINDRITNSGTVAKVGDVDGDGYDDFTVASAVASSNAGEVYLIFGRPDLSWNAITDVNGNFSLTNISQSNRMVRFVGRATGNGLRLVSGLGDINNDGFADFSLSTSTGGFGNQGSITIVFGRNTAGWNSLGGTAGLFNLSNTTESNGMIQFLGSANNAYLGESLPKNVGDINGDGYQDIGFGSSGARCGTGACNGEAHIVFGRSTTDWQDLTGTNGDFNLINATEALGMLYLVGQGAGFGSNGRLTLWTGVLPAGDVNNDGIEDVLIGAGREGQSTVWSGAVYVLLGRSTTNWNTWTPANGSILLNTNVSAANGLYRIQGRYPGGNMSEGILAGNQDFDNDGFSDIVCGYHSTTWGNTNGEVYIIFGRTTTGWTSLSGSDGIINLSSDKSAANRIIAFSGRATNDQLYRDSGLAGREDGLVGDVNGDGFQDLLIQARFADGGGTDSGEAYLVLGRNASDWSALGGTTGDFSLLNTSLANRVFRFIGREANSNFSYGATPGLGDINGDGFDDFLIGAMSETVNSNGGAAYLFPGRSQSDWNVLIPSSGNFTLTNIGD